jgi:hypothetical protein
MKFKKLFIKSFPIIIGAILGFSYYYFIGCKSGGTCPITSSPYISTIYGAVSGAIFLIK